MIDLPLVNLVITVLPYIDSSHIRNFQLSTVKIFPKWKVRRYLQILTLCFLPDFYLKCPGICANFRLNTHMGAAGCNCACVVCHLSDGGIQRPHNFFESRVRIVDLHCKILRNYQSYARHYNPRLLFTPLLKANKVFLRSFFFEKFWLYVRLVLKSGFMSRAGYSSLRTVDNSKIVKYWLTLLSLDC